MPGPSASITLQRDWNEDKGIPWPLGEPLGGAASALYTVGETLNLLQEINSQKHKARGVGLSEVSESGVCPRCVPGKGSRKAK